MFKHLMTDEYVANMLIEDAKASSSKYSNQGLQAYRPQRPSGTAPKPNTRFLKNILRDTDNHNSALLAKEKCDARARQRLLDDPKNGHKRDGRHEERRQKRSRLDHTEGKNDVETREPRRKSIDRYRSHKRDEFRHRHERSRSPRRDDHIHRQGSRSRSRSEERYSKRRDRSHHSSHHRRPARSASPRPSHRSRRRKRTPSREPSPRHGRHPPDSDSDPLEAIIGPAPPPKVRTRGRGALTGSSRTMDEHFAATYNPSVDVRPNSEDDDDWDQALEAMRDRQKWKAAGAVRLREAGFTDEQVGKWERGGDGDVTDVKWSKRGEGREWDRGKVMTEEAGIDDLDVTLKPEWGRLKGT